MNIFDFSYTLPVAYSTISGMKRELLLILSLFLTVSCTKDKVDFKHVAVIEIETSRKTVSADRDRFEKLAFQEFAIPGNRFRTTTTLNNNVKWTIFVGQYSEVQRFFDLFKDVLKSGWSISVEYL